MYRVVLVEFGSLLDLAHHDDYGRGAGEDGIASPLVGLPGADEMGDALLEELAIDLDFCHDGSDCDARSGR